MKKAEAIKVFFSVPGKPVTNIELIDFAKKDREGYEELGLLALKALGETAS